MKVSILHGYATPHQAILVCSSYAPKPIVPRSGRKNVITHNWEKIKGYEEAKKVLGDFSFHEFNILREMCYSVENDNRLTMIMENYPSSYFKREKRYRMQLSFEGVRSFRIGTKDDSRKCYFFGQVPGFDIIDISDRKWENLRWAFQALTGLHGSLHFLMARSAP